MKDDKNDVNDTIKDNENDVKNNIESKFRDKNIRKKVETEKNLILFAYTNEFM